MYTEAVPGAACRTLRQHCRSLGEGGGVPVGRGCLAEESNQVPDGVPPHPDDLSSLCQSAPLGVDRSSSQSALSERSGRWNGRVWCGLASSHRSWLLQQVQVSSVMNNKHHSGRRLSPQASLSYKPPPLLASLSSLALRLLRACRPSLAPRLSLSRTHPGGGALGAACRTAVARGEAPENESG